MAEDMEAPPQEFLLGEYICTAAGGIPVTADMDRGSSKVGRVQQGTKFNVESVAEAVLDKRIRAQIDRPLKGWVSLKHVESGHLFAQYLTDRRKTSQDMRGELVSSAVKSEGLDEDSINPQKRSCTDIAACLVLVALMAGLVVMHVTCFTKASPWKLTRPLDHQGNSCGLGEYEQWPYVYYPAKTMITGGPLVLDAHYFNPVNRWGVCTSDCPTGFSRHDRLGFCHGEAVGTCTWYSDKPTTLVLGRYCVVGLPGTTFSDPVAQVCASVKKAVADVHEEATKSIIAMGDDAKKDLNGMRGQLEQVSQWTVDAANGRLDQDVRLYRTALDNAAEASRGEHIAKVCEDFEERQRNVLIEMVSDIIHADKVMAVAVVLNLLLGEALLLLLCFAVKPIVYGSIGICVLGFFIAGVLFWEEAIEISDTGLVGDGNEEKLLAVVCWVITFFCILVVFCARKSLRLALAISSATSGFILKSVGILFLPMMISVVEIAWGIYWVFALCGILSTANVKAADNLTQEFSRFEINGGIVCMLCVHFFIGLWVHWFLEGLSVVATSITVTDWYFTPKVENSKPPKFFSFAISFIKAAIYHSGSVSLGSLILSMVVTIRHITAFFVALLEKVDDDMYLATCSFKCLNCCTACLVHGLETVTSDAYVLLGITGKGFCKSAWEAFSLQVRNAVHFRIFFGVMWTVNIVCRFLLMLVTLAICALLLNKSVFPKFTEEVKSPYGPLLVVMLISYCLGGMSVGICTASGNSLFYCFVVDEESAIKSGRDIALYAPGELQALLEQEATQWRTKLTFDPERLDEGDNMEKHSEPTGSDKSYEKKAE